MLISAVAATIEVHSIVVVVVVVVVILVVDSTGASVRLIHAVRLRLRLQAKRRPPAAKDARWILAAAAAADARLAVNDWFTCPLPRPQPIGPTTHRTPSVLLSPRSAWRFPFIIIFIYHTEYN